LLAVGEHVAPSSYSSVLRAANGFRGGVASTREELCGALAAGIMLIGLLYGRDDVSQDDSYGKAITARWLEEFSVQFGSTRCRPIYERMHSPEGPGSCALVARETSLLLLRLLPEADQARSR